MLRKVKVDIQFKNKILLLKFASKNAISSEFEALDFKKLFTSAATIVPLQLVPAFYPCPNLWTSGMSAVSMKERDKIILFLRGNRLNLQAFWHGYVS